MTITHSSTRLVASVAGVAVAAALIAGAFAVQPAKAALSSSQVSAIITLLQSFGADSATIANVQASLTGGTPSSGGGSTSGGAGACYTWTRDLQAGSTGADVTALQVFLNSNSATMVAASGAGSAGMETSTFGPATKAAVMKFQTANGIAPAAGYFGPVTRAAVAAKCSGGGTGSTPSTPSGPLSGGEGQIDNINSLGDIDTSVDEGDSAVKVLGAEFDAKDSDVSVQRVDVDIKSHSGNGSSRLTNYITKVSLWLDGKKLASLDAGDVDKDSNNVYSFRFSGMNGVVREGNTGNLYVSVDAVDNLDSTDDADTWVVNIPQDGIRAVDGAGISDTYVTSTESTDLSETITFGTQSGGTLQITEGNSNPEAGLVVVDDNNETSNVTLLAFDLKAKNSDVTIHDFPIGIAATGGNTNLIVKRVQLKHGSTVLKTKTISGTGYNEVVFDNVDLDINEDDTESFTVTADIFDTDSGEPDNGDSVVASTTNALTGWDAEDAMGDNLAEPGDFSGSVGGNAQTFYSTQGVAVTFKSASASKTVGSIAGAPDTGDFTVKFSVKNLGDTRVYFDGDVTAGSSTPTAVGGLHWATTTDSTTGTSTSGATAIGTGIVSADVSDSDDVLNSGDKRFVLESGETRDFTFAVSIPAGGDNVNAGIKLTGFAWDTTSQDNMVNLYNFDLGAFHTNTLTGLYIQ